MLKTLVFPITLAMLLLTACIIPGARKERAELELQANDSLFLIEEGPFHFRMVFPKDLLINNEPAFSLSENGEELSIRCGSNFSLSVRQGQNYLDMLQKFREHDLLFNYQVLDNEDGSIVYSRIFPEGKTFDYRLIQSLKIGNQNYTFFTAPEQEFNLNDVLRMKSALASVQF